MKRESPADSGLAPAESNSNGASLWLWVAGGFLFLGLLWAAMFVVAHRANIQSVPLAAPAGGGR